MNLPKSEGKKWGRKIEGKELDRIFVLAML